MWSSQVVMKPKTIAAAQFKAQCLALLDEVERTKSEWVVTKRGLPIARLVPLAPRRSVKARARLVGDVTRSVDTEWLK